MIIEVSTIINAPIEQVWPWLDDFTGWHRWLPVITGTTMDDGLDQGPVGSVRIMTNATGGTGRERLLSKDVVHHTLTYTSEGDSPFPLRSYVSTVRLEPVTTAGTTFIQWSAVIDADATDEASLRQTFEGIYQMFFDSLDTATNPAE